MTENAVGEAIRRVRKERGITQAALAYDAHIDGSTIALIETGKRNPSVKVLLAIADALAVDPGELLPKAHGPLPGATVAAQRTIPLEEFAEALEGLGLGALNDLGRELAREHHKATGAHDWERAADLYRRRLIVWEKIQELDPPLAEITYRADGPTEVLFYRDPTADEEAQLREKLGEYEVVRDLVPAV